MTWHIFIFFLYIQIAPSRLGHADDLTHLSVAIVSTNLFFWLVVRTCCWLNLSCKMHNLFKESLWWFWLLIFTKCLCGMGNQIYWFPINFSKYLQIYSFLMLKDLEWYLKAKSGDYLSWSNPRFNAFINWLSNSWSQITTYCQQCRHSLLIANYASQV